MKNGYYEKNKYLLYKKLLLPVTDSFLIRKREGKFEHHNAWFYLLKYYWYEPYFYFFVIRCFINCKLPFFNAIKERLLFLYRPTIWLKLNVDSSFIKKQLRWRQINPHNKTKLACDFEESKVFVGLKTIGDLWVFDDENSNAILRIGNNCVIGQNVHFILSDIDLATRGIKANIIVGDNVKIGRDVIVYPGVNIGNNVTVYAGSVVTETIDNNVSVSSNPARIIMSGNKK
jgi:acetyltransferase-like isoleucine patch superfamily enzyme